MIHDRQYFYGTQHPKAENTSRSITAISRAIDSCKTEKINQLERGSAGFNLTPASQAAIMKDLDGCVEYQTQVAKGIGIMPTDVKITPLISSKE
jgi:hypothetical protein